MFAVFYFGVESRLQVGAATAAQLYLLPAQGFNNRAIDSLALEFEVFHPRHLFYHVEIEKAVSLELVVFHFFLGEVVSLTKILCYLFFLFRELVVLAVQILGPDHLEGVTNGHELLTHLL